MAARAISGAHGAVVAVWAMPGNHRATWSDAPGVIATGGAGGRIGFRDLNGEQAEGQQARSNRFHRSSPASQFARLPCWGHAPCQVTRALVSSAAKELAYSPPALASASLQPSLRSAACDFMQAAIPPPPRFASAHSFLASARQALLTAVARMIAT